MRSRSLLWLVVVASIAIPTVCISIWPQLYSNPIVVFLLSVLTSAISVIASHEEFAGAARRRTQTEWLSQAESACDRLLTTGAQVQRMRARASSACADAIKSVPELEETKLRAVRIVLSSNCQNIAAQLHDINDHLESAIADWQRFIRKNCEGADCEIIGRGLERRRAELAQDKKSLVCDQETSPNPLPQTSIAM